MVHPKQIEDPAATAAYIAQKLGFTKKKVLRKKIEELVPKLTPTGLTDATVLRQLDPAVVDDILSEHPAGLFAEQEPSPVLPVRPAGAAAARLHRRRPERPAGRRARVQPQPLPGRAAGRAARGAGARRRADGDADAAPAAAGRDVQLTIDQAIQAKRAVGARRPPSTSSKAQSATAIVLDPQDRRDPGDGHRPPATTTTTSTICPPSSFPSATRNRAVAGLLRAGLDLQGGDDGRRPDRPTSSSRR